MERHDAERVLYKWIEAAKELSWYYSVLEKRNYKSVAVSMADYIIMLFF